MGMPLGFLKNWVPHLNCVKLSMGSKICLIGLDITSLVQSILFFLEFSIYIYIVF